LRQVSLRAMAVTRQSSLVPLGLASHSSSFTYYGNWSRISNLDAVDSILDDDEASKIKSTASRFNFTCLVII
jgi:hypothetical protein